MDWKCWYSSKHFPEPPAQWICQILTLFYCGSRTPMEGNVDKLIDQLTHPSQAPPLEFITIPPPVHPSHHAHLRRADKIEGVEFMHEVQEHKCCRKGCLQNFTWNEVSSLYMHSSDLLRNQLQETLQILIGLSVSALHQQLRLQLKNFEVRDAADPNCHAAFFPFVATTLLPSNYRREIAQ